MVDWPGLLELSGLFEAFHSVGFHRTHCRGFVLLAVRTTKDDHLAAHVGCELNGEMPETANVRLGIEVESVGPAEGDGLLSNGLQRRERCSCDPVAVHVGERKSYVPSSSHDPQVLDRP